MQHMTDPLVTFHLLSQTTAAPVSGCVPCRSFQLISYATAMQIYIYIYIMCYFYYLLFNINLWTIVITLGPFNGIIYRLYALLFLETVTTMYLSTLSVAEIQSTLIILWRPVRKNSAYYISGDGPHRNQVECLKLFKIQSLEVARPTPSWQTKFSNSFHSIFQLCSKLSILLFLVHSVFRCLCIYQSTFLSVCSSFRQICFTRLGIGLLARSTRQVMNDPFYLIFFHFL